MAIIDNSLSSLGYYVYRLAAILRRRPARADALGGTIQPDAGRALRHHGDRRRQHRAGHPAQQAVDTWLAGTANNISSIATVLNAMNTHGDHSKPLTVIAG